MESENFENTYLILRNLIFNFKTEIKFYKIIIKSLLTTIF